MDLCLTKDSEVVVIHDSNLERLCDNNKPVNYYNYDELPEFSDQVFIHFSNRKYCHTKEIREKYIPKLAVSINEVFIYSSNYSTLTD